MTDLALILLAQANFLAIQSQAERQPHIGMYINKIPHIIYIIHIKNATGTHDKLVEISVSVHRKGKTLENCGPQLKRILR